MPSDNILYSRRYKYDDFRFMLLFLVLFGHSIELYTPLPSGRGLQGITVNIYRIIYSFHMPAFIFLSGKFAKPGVKRALRHLLVPYFAFQTIYLLFDYFILRSGALSIQYTTPYWLLWYLPVVFIYYLIIGFIPQKSPGRAFTVLLICFVLSLAVVFSGFFAYSLSLSRLFVFSPFFFLGYYSSCLCEYLSSKFHYLKKAAIPVGLMLAITGLLYLISAGTPIRLLYGARSYAFAQTSAIERAIFLITALGWIILFCRIIPDRYISFVSDYGSNTMPVYLLHGFVMRLLGKLDVFRFSTSLNLLLSLLTALLLILLFGNKFMSQLFKKLF